MPVIKKVYETEYAPIDIDIDKNRNFRRPFQFLEDDGVTPIDMTGFSVTAQIRKEESVDSTLIEDFTVDTSDLVNGNIVLILSVAQTAAINHSTGYYDIKVTDLTPTTTSWVKGKVSIHGTVTA
jgi:hypothetical protein